MTNPITLKINQVKKSFPGLELPVLDNISLTVRVAEKIAITGVSGSGKSTLLHLMAVNSTFRTCCKPIKIYSRLGIGLSIGVPHH